MSIKVIIRDLFANKIEKLDIKCVDCDFWFDHNNKSLLKNISNIESISDIKDLLHSRLFEKNYSKASYKKLAVFQNNGGIIKGAFKDRKCIGILFAGDFNLFPKLKSFKVFPPDPESIFLGCIYVEPAQRGLGIEKRLLIELEKDLLKKKAISVETIAKRLNDDIDEDDFENSPLISFKFLINNGFYLKKNDAQYPLLRLDFQSIAKDFVKEELTLEKLIYKKTARSPVIIKQK
jgi:GNAT superfamily N-acetyltransferase